MWTCYSQLMYWTLQASTGTTSNLDLVILLVLAYLLYLKKNRIFRFVTGSELSVDKSAVVLSWRVNKGVQFLIDGPKAHLVFNVLRPADAEQVSLKGFFISYQVIGNYNTSS